MAAVRCFCDSGLSGRLALPGLLELHPSPPLPQPARHPYLVSRKPLTPPEARRFLSPCCICAALGSTAEKEGQGGPCACVYVSVHVCGRACVRACVGVNWLFGSQVNSGAVRGAGVYSRLGAYGHTSGPLASLGLAGRGRT